MNNKAYKLHAHCITEVYDSQIYFALRVYHRYVCLRFKNSILELLDFPIFLFYSYTYISILQIMCKILKWSNWNCIVPSTIKCSTSTCPKHTFLILITQNCLHSILYYAQNYIIIPLALLQKFRINVILACCTFILVSLASAL